MTSRERWIGRALALIVMAAVVLSFAPISTASCSGPMYIYYETAAKLVETGAKLVCPGGTYYDEGPGGAYQETPYFVVQTMSCPCGGGGGGDGDPYDGPP